MANIVVVSGRMVADPELRNISEDKAVCNFRIAVPKRFKPQEGADSDFFNAVAWNRTAEFICKYFSKGKRIELVGSLQTRNWEDREGNRRTATEIAVSSVDFVGDKEKPNQKGQQPKSAADRRSALVTPLRRHLFLTRGILIMKMVRICLFEAIP